MLHRASEVKLVCWGESGDFSGDLLRMRAEAAQQWLMRHSVHADVQVLDPQPDIATAMLARATEMAADLIVMGAYGHTRWTERMLGGATRGMLESMTVPVVMSH